MPSARKRCVHDRLRGSSEAHVVRRSGIDGRCNRLAHHAAIALAQSSLTRAFTGRWLQLKPRSQAHHQPAQRLKMCTDRALGFMACDGFHRHRLAKLTAAQSQQNRLGHALHPVEPTLACAGRSGCGCSSFSECKTRGCSHGKSSTAKQEVTSIALLEHRFASADRRLKGQWRCSRRITQRLGERIGRCKWAVEAGA